MKKNNVILYLINILLCVSLVFLLLAGCDKKTRDNPFDPGSDDYEGDDGDGEWVDVPVYYQDFEAYPNLASFPMDGWKTNYRTLLNCSIAAGSGYDISKGAYFEGSTAAQNSFIEIYRNDVPLDMKHFFIEFKVLTLNTVDDCDAFFILSDPTGTTKFLKVGFQDVASVGMIYYSLSSGGSGYGTELPVVGIWYHFQIEIDKTRSRMSIFYTTDENNWKVLADDVVISFPPVIPRFGFRVTCMEMATGEDVVLDELDIYKTVFRE